MEYRPIPFDRYSSENISGKAVCILEDTRLGRKYRTTITDVCSRTLLEGAQIRVKAKSGDIYEYRPLVQDVAEAKRIENELLKC